MVQTEREYAEALFALAQEEQSAAEYLESLNVVKNVIEENPEYIEYLASPAIPLSERTASLEEAFGESMPEYVVSFLKLLCENGKVRTLFACIEEFAKFVSAFSGRAQAVITSAVELNDMQKNSICKKLETVTGKSIDPVFIIDESLIGGVKVEVDGKIFDGSIKNRLGDMKDVMNS